MISNVIFHLTANKEVVVILNLINFSVWLHFCFSLWLNFSFSKLLSSFTISFFLTCDKSPAYCFYWKRVPLTGKKVNIWLTASENLTVVQRKKIVFVQAVDFTNEQPWKRGESILQLSIWKTRLRKLLSFIASFPLSARLTWNCPFIKQSNFFFLTLKSIYIVVLRIIFISPRSKLQKETVSFQTSIKSENKFK